MSSAVALALVATLGAHTASAQKGKEQRKKGNPVKVRIISENLTTGEVGRNISAAAGDEVRMTLYVDNRTGESQAASIHIFGGIPGCYYEDTLVENFVAGEQKAGSYTRTVPYDQSGILNVDVDVVMLKSQDAAAWDASVTFGAPLKGEAPANGSIFERTMLRMMMRAMLTLTSNGPSIDDISVSDFKQLYR